MQTRKLYSMPCAQAEVIGTDSCSSLKSYATNVCGHIRTLDGDFYYCTGTYSATTRKHIGAYAKEMGLDYYFFKGIASADLTFYNPETGEIVIEGCENFNGMAASIKHNCYKLRRW